MQGECVITFQRQLSCGGEQRTLVRNADARALAKPKDSESLRVITFSGNFYVC